MLSPSFIITCNRAIKQKGAIPIPSAYKWYMVKELKNTQYETKMRINSKWYFMTIDQEEKICSTLRQNGFDV